jgi:S1-C subfamily serine protease
MAAPRFLLKTDLATVHPLQLQGRPVHAMYDRLSELLRSRGGGGAEGLFAEPVGGAGAISWYGEGNGDPRPMASLSASRRTEAEARLRRQLDAITPLLDDPESGPLLKRALVLPDTASIVVLDDSVILTGWSLAPPDIGTDDAALAAQVRRTLGPYSARLAAADDGFFAANPVPRPIPPPVARPGPVAPPPVPPVPPGRPPGPQAAGAADSGGSGRAFWLVPLLIAVALLFLCLGFWAAWAHFVRDMAGRQVTAPIADEAATRNAIRQQRETNETLERELERARRAAAQPNVCTPDGPLGIQPSPERQPVRPEAVPPRVPQQQGQTVPPFSGSLAQLLEHATVMVVGAGPRGVGHGSGFFVSGDTIVTNAHVVEHADPAQIYVMSTSLGRALPAQLVTTSRPAGGGDIEPGQPDFAILRLSQPVPGAQPLALTRAAEKLTDVVAAGYPASVVRVEGGMRDLQEGRLGQPPELVLTRGNISTIQRLDTGLVVMPHSADISPGNSGGPLVDTCGRVVGINTFVSRATSVADRVKYAQKADSMLPWLTQQNVQVQEREGTCQPALPTLPAMPPGAGGTQVPGPAPGSAPGTPPNATSPNATPIPAPGSTTPPSGQPAPSGGAIPGPATPSPPPAGASPGGSPAAGTPPTGTPPTGTPPTGTPPIGTPPIGTPPTGAPPAATPATPAPATIGPTVPANPSGAVPAPSTTPPAGSPAGNAL